MARKLDPKCEQCRREGEKLFLKGQRCYSPKCAIVRKAYSPGVHGRTRRRPPSEYGVQLREKQKIKRMYGVLERQFKNYFQKASRRKGATDELLLSQLETRLDNVVYRLGFASSRASARQLVNHGHFRVNDKKVNIPSFQVRTGDIISVREKSKKTAPFKSLKSVLKGKETPSWLSLDKEKLEGKVVSLPQKEDLQIGVDPSLVIEYYSK